MMESRISSGDSHWGGWSTREHKVEVAVLVRTGGRLGGSTGALRRCLEQKCALQGGRVQVRTEGGLSYDCALRGVWSTSAH